MIRVGFTVRCMWRRYAVRNCGCCRPIANCCSLRRLPSRTRSTRYFTQQRASNARNTAAPWVHRTVQFASLETTKGRKCNPTRSLIVGISVPGLLGRGPLRAHYRWSALALSLVPGPHGCPRSSHTSQRPIYLTLKRNGGNALGSFLHLVAANAGSHDRSSANLEPKPEFNIPPLYRSYVRVVALRRRGTFPRVPAVLANHMQFDDPISIAAASSFDDGAVNMSVDK